MTGDRRWALGDRASGASMGCAETALPNAYPLSPSAWSDEQMRFRFVKRAQRDAQAMEEF
jgi:hypothetical protein